jgi:hypothetical protein
MALRDAALNFRQERQIELLEGRVNKLESSMATVLADLGRVLHLLEGDGQKGLVVEVTEFHAAYHQSEKDREATETRRWQLLTIFIAALTLAVLFLGFLVSIRDIKAGVITLPKLSHSIDPIQAYYRIQKPQRAAIPTLR